MDNILGFYHANIFSPFIYYGVC